MAKKRKKVERKEAVVDSHEMLRLIKEAYKAFNEVLKNGDASEKFSAMIKMQLLSQKFGEYVSAYDEKNLIPTHEVIKAVRDIDTPALNELRGETDEVEQVMRETGKLLVKKSPIKGKISKAKSGRNRIRRLAKRRIKD